MAIVKTTNTSELRLKPNANIILPEQRKNRSGFTTGYIQKTHTDLRNDPRYQEEAEKFLNYLSEQEGVVEKITGGLISNDIFETLRDEEGRLGTAIDRARIMRDAPEDIKQTYRYLRDEFEASKAGSFNEIAKAAFDRGVDMFADPINLLFAFVAPGVGSAASKAAAPAVTNALMTKGGQQAASKTLRNIAASNTAKAGAFEGAVWTGAENFARQDINISTGVQDVFSKGDFALSTGAGLVLGGGLGYTLGSLFTPTPTRVDDIVSDNVNTAPKKIDFNDPETPKPTTIPYQTVEKVGDEDAIVIKDAEIIWGPTNKIRNGMPINATRIVNDDKSVTIKVHDDALRQTFQKKPWTKPQEDGVTPLKPNDIRTEDEWIMFNLFHELNHASYLRPKGMSKAIYENGANVAALRDLKVWRRTKEMPRLSPEAKTIAQIIDSKFNKAVMGINPITGREYLNRIETEGLDNKLLETLVTGKKVKLNEDGLLEETTLDVSLNEKDAANIILAVKNIIIKESDNAAPELTLNKIDPIVKENIRKYNLNPNQIKDIVTEVAETYGPNPKFVTENLKNTNTQLKVEQLISQKNMNTLIRELSNVVKGGKETREILSDELNNAVLTNSTPLDVKLNFITKAQDKLSRYLSTSIGGFIKATNLLNPAKRFAPNVVGRLQRLITSEIDQSWRLGKTQVREASDYSSYMSERFGQFHVKWKSAYDNIKATAKGKTKEEIDILISNAVRNGNTVFDNITFGTPEAKEATVNAADTLREILGDIATESKSKGLLRQEVENYLPRMWNREAIEKNREDFIQRIMNRKGAVGINTYDEASNFVDELLDIKYQFGNEHRFGGNSFFANRKIDLKDETYFNDYLETNLEVITNSYFSAAAKGLAKKDILNVRNIEDFNRTWIPALEREMKANNASSELIQQAKEDASYLYKNITGEGMERYGKKLSLLTDGYMLANRMAYLPLATLSSITEIFINMSKAGPGTAFRGFRDAVMNGSQKMYYDSMDVLQKVHGLTRAESQYELNQLGIALDQASADMVERLSGDTLSNATMRKISNKFFRLNLLDQWTKTVQLASYITGKRLIIENIENLASKMPLIKSGQISRRMKRQIDELKDLRIDYTEGVKWYNNGAKLDDPFYNKIKRGGGTYTNEVILNPTAQSGLKPTFMSNPKTAVFGQLLGYPAAFTNTVMKGMAKQITRNPETIFSQHLPTVAIMTGIASLANGVRSNGESYDDKEAFEIAMDGFIRTGANGLIADMIKRGADAAEYYQDPMAYFTGLGVIPGDAYKLARQGDILSFVVNKFPGTGVRDLLLGLYDEDAPDDFKDTMREADKALTELIVPSRERVQKQTFYKGGEVYNVPQVPVEPDERIDKMTGLPYDIQAGEAFVDAEDRDIRQDYGKGGKVLNTLINMGAHLAFGVSPSDQRKNEREAAAILHQAILDNKIPAHYAVPVDEAGYPDFKSEKNQKLFEEGVYNEEVYDAINHGLISFRQGTNPVRRGALQLKEGVQRKIVDDPRTEEKDAFNNAKAFNLREQGYTEEEAIQEFVNSYAKTTQKLMNREPLIRGEDFIFNINDLNNVDQKQIGLQDIFPRQPKNKGGKILKRLEAMA